MGRRAETPRLANFYEFSLNFPLAILFFFLKFAGPLPRQKMIIQYFPSKRVLRPKPPERHRKFKIFTEKSEDFYEILKEFNGK